MVNYDDLVGKGYYYGHVQEIFKDMSVFYDFEQEAKILTATKDRNCAYVSDIKGHLSMYYSRSIPYNKVWVRRETVKKKNLAVSQQWWTYSLRGTTNADILARFKSAITDYMISIYGHLGLSDRNIAHGDNVTVYENGDYSEMHNDGRNVGRYAVIIIYFGEDYNDNGGEFIVDDGVIIKPVRGNFVMLDFTQNNPAHGVMPVTGNFKRLSYLDFIANLDMQ
jgi:hypothetical protein